MTHRARRLTTNLWISCLLCLLFLAHTPLSSGQELKSSDVAALLNDLKTDDAKVRFAAAKRLLSAGAEARAAVSVLLELVKLDDKEIRLQVFDVIEDIGPEARDAVPVLAEALKDEAPIVRHAALRALGSIGRDKSNVVALGRELKNKDPLVRAVAAGRLAAIGDKAQAAAPTLIEMLKDEDKNTRRLAIYILGATRTEAPVPTLLALLKDEDREMRRSAIIELSWLGPKARDAVPALIKILVGNDDDLRGHAASALGELGPDAKSAAPILLKMLKEPKAEMRSAAAYALRKVELEASAVPVVAEALRDGDPMVRMYATEMLRNLGSTARDATPLLADLLKAPEMFIRFEAANTLRAIGPGAKDAVPVLLKSLNDRHPYVRTMVAIALLKIAPESESRITPDVLAQARDQIERVEKKGGRYGLGFIPAPQPKSAEAASHMQRGRQLYQQGLFGAALVSFTKAVEIDPGYADAYHSRGLVRRARGENDAALADFTKAINTASESPEMHYHARGLTQVARGDFDAAIADLTEVIRLNPYNADAYFARGLAHERKGNHDAAIADYDRALGFIPPVTEAYGPRGMAKLAQGKVAEAIADFKEAIKLDSQNSANYEGLGDAYARLGNIEKARDAWSQALSLAPAAESKSRLEGKLSAQSLQTRESSSVKLGDKVIVIPNPEGFEEASSQFEEIRRVLAIMQLPHSDTLLLHMPVSDCDRLRTGFDPEFHHYTKVSVLKSMREVTSSNADMAGLVTEWRKNGAVLFEPDGPLWTSMMERLSRKSSEAASKQITYDVNDTQDLGEFDIRPNVYSRMIFLMYTKDIKGTKSMFAAVGSMTFLKVGRRIINVGVYRNLSSPAAVKSELKPAVIEVKQFTTKWIDEILAANGEQQ